MSPDISHILRDWPYRSGEVTARKIIGQDGREKIQLRLDLGILQMEAVGRPDGQRPNGHESLLDYYQKQFQRHRVETGSDEGFNLDEQACELLRGEGIMYYHRYLAMFVLEDFEAVERDVLRNLRLFDFCRLYAAEESDRFVLEQFRPYVHMMLARARALTALRDNRPKAALVAVKEGMSSIREFHRRFGREKETEQSAEYTMLMGLGKEIESRLPADPVQRVRSELAKAVREERYEEAAMLRDQLKQLRK